MSYTHNDTESTIEPEQIKARLALLSPTVLAKKWGVQRSLISFVINGHQPFSPLVGKIARLIKVPKVELRTYLVTEAARHEERKRGVAA